MKGSLLFPWIKPEIEGWFKPEITIDGGVVTLFINGEKVTDGIVVEAPQEVKAFAEFRRDIHNSRIICTAIEHKPQSLCLGYSPQDESELRCYWCHKVGASYECIQPKLVKFLSPE